MKLPDHFSFNQQNLQDYLDCSRRFYLRHILRQDWPAIESEPVKEQEALILLGEQFHRMVQQLFAGIPQDIIEGSINDLDLLNWWHQFIHLDIQSQPGSKFSEVLFSIPFEETRLIAKYDLIVYQENQQAIIFDWKTSRHLPKEKWLGIRMQTRIYPFLLSVLSTQPGAAFHLSPDQIQMVYWYPAFPDHPVAFPYSQSQFAEDERYLSSTIHEIVHLDESGFTKTDNEKMCKYCRYRSLCDRGISAGERSVAEELEIDSDSAFDIDFDQISAAE
jgi:CRISPR/Cas system-associated exonuclease Cas4 (RecB family)